MLLVRVRRGGILVGVCLSRGVLHRVGRRQADRAAGAEGVNSSCDASCRVGLVSEGKKRRRAKVESIGFQVREGGKGRRLSWCDYGLKARGRDLSELWLPQTIFRDSASRQPLHRACTGPSTGQPAKRKRDQALIDSVASLIR